MLAAPCLDWPLKTTTQYLLASRGQERGGEEIKWDFSVDFLLLIGNKFWNRSFHVKRSTEAVSIYLYSFPILLILYIVPTAEQTLHWTCCLHWLISSKGEIMTNYLNFFLFSYNFADFHHYADILPNYVGIFRKFNNNVLLLELRCTCLSSSWWQARQWWWWIAICNIPAGLFLLSTSQAAANEGKSSAVNGKRSSFDLLALQQVY